MIDDFEPKILAFVCNWCGYAAADLAGVSRIQYVTNIRVIRVMCSGRVHPKFIMTTFLNGIDGVLLVGCHLTDCHYISGINVTLKMSRAIKNKLKKVGIAPERVRLEHLSASEGAKFAEAVNDFNNAITKLGILELNFEQEKNLMQWAAAKTGSEEPKREKRHVHK
jgi:F420-non-reducing hydrogenase iron-sulfur subunit